MSANSLFSKRSIEGYLTIDNSLAEGPAGKREYATLTCSHCQQQVLKNPDRTRERAYCRRCDRYLCDACGVLALQTIGCKPFKQIADEIQEQAIRAEQSGSFILRI